MYWKGFNEQQRKKPGLEDAVSHHADWVYDGGYDLYKHGHRISDKAYIWEGFYGMVYRDRCAGGFSLRVYSYTEIPE